MPVWPLQACEVLDAASIALIFQHRKSLDPDLQLNRLGAECPSHRPGTGGSAETLRPGLETRKDLMPGWRPAVSFGGLGGGAGRGDEDARGQRRRTVREVLRWHCRIRISGRTPEWNPENRFRPSLEAAL